ncbi:GlsB/YeaQ/YmgE family stress response membrane protein [Micromonospora sp. LZ34]
MTATGLGTAVAVGLAVGALGRFAAPGRREIPVWLALVVGVVTAVLGTVVVGLADAGGRFDLLDLVVQIGSAAAGVALVAVTTGHGRSDPA